MTLGTRISDRRRKLGISQKTLAKELGITASMLCKIEHDVVRPRKELLLKIQYFLDLDDLAETTYICDNVSIGLENLEKRVTDAIRELEDILYTIKAIKLNI